MRSFAPSLLRSCPGSTVAEWVLTIRCCARLKTLSGKPNERTMFELPADRSRLMALLRGGGELPGEPAVGQHMLASSCVLRGAPPPSRVKNPETYHVCRPGTGLFKAGLPGDRMPTAAAAEAPERRRRRRRRAGTRRLFAIIVAIMIIRPLPTSHALALFQCAIDAALPQDAVGWHHALPSVEHVRCRWLMVAPDPDVGAPRCPGPHLQEAPGMARGPGTTPCRWGGTATGRRRRSPTSRTRTPGRAPPRSLTGRCS